MTDLQLSILSFAVSLASLVMALVNLRAVKRRERANHERA